MASCSLTNHTPSSCSPSATDNDGLWTSLLVAAEAFRYKVTASVEAGVNAWELFQGMKFLTEVRIHIHAHTHTHTHTHTSKSQNCPLILSFSTLSFSLPIRLQESRECQLDQCYYRTPVCQLPTGTTLPPNQAGNGEETPAQKRYTHTLHLFFSSSSSSSFSSSSIYHCSS